MEREHIFIKYLESMLETVKNFELAELLKCRHAFTVHQLHNWSNKPSGVHCAMGRPENVEERSHAKSQMQVQENTLSSFEKDKWNGLHLELIGLLT